MPFISYVQKSCKTIAFDSLYTVLSSVLLTFIGVKMLLPLVEIKIDTFVSMIVIIGILLLSVVLSLLFPPKAKTA